MNEIFLSHFSSRFATGAHEAHFLIPFSCKHLCTRLTFYVRIICSVLLEISIRSYGYDDLKRSLRSLQTMQWFYHMQVTLTANGLKFLLMEEMTQKMWRSVITFLFHFSLHFMKPLKYSEVVLDYHKYHLKIQRLKIQSITGRGFFPQMYLKNGDVINCINKRFKNFYY